MKCYNFGSNVTVGKFQIWPMGYSPILIWPIEAMGHMEIWAIGQKKVLGPLLKWPYLLLHPWYLMDICNGRRSDFSVIFVAGKW